MNNTPGAVWILALAILGWASCSSPRQSRQPVPGGYAAMSVTSSEAVAAARFAVEAQDRRLRADSASSGSPLRLLRLVQADEQVVAGKNYRLVLRVGGDGGERTAVATVWWQSWRTPDPYQLTAWEWR